MKWILFYWLYSLGRNTIVTGDAEFSTRERCIHAGIDISIQARERGGPDAAFICTKK